MASVIGFAGLGAMVAALIFTILSVALPYWTTGGSDGVDINSGLWRYCIESSVLNLCGDVMDVATDDEAKDRIRAVRAMMLLGMIVLAGAIVPAALYLFVMKDNNMLGFIGGGLTIVGGLFDMIGFAVFAEGSEEDSETSYNVGIAFAIIGWLTGWIAGALTIVATMKEGNSGKVLP